MKVYIGKPTEAYTGCCVVIAANNLEEAQRMAEDEMVYNDSVEVSEATDLQTTRTEPGVIISELYFE